MPGLFFSHVQDDATKRNFDHIASVLNPIVASVQVGLGKTPTWIAPSLSTGWRNLSASGGNSAVAGYNLDATGRVNSKGFVFNTTAGGLTGAVYVLPKGMRPLEARSFVCRGYDGAGLAIYVTTVSPDGTVSAVSSVPTSGWISLELSFQAEQ